MTRLCIAPPLPPKPASASLCELAITAGLAGHSVTLFFQGFAAPTLCQLWRHYIRFATPETVRHIYTQADVRKLAKGTNGVRLVLVYTARLCNQVSWIIQTANSALENGSPQPALFCCVGTGEMEKAPGPAVVLRDNGPEQAAVAQWLLTGGNDHPDWQAIPAAVNIQADPALGAGLMVLNRPGADGRGVRNRQVLNALLAGSTLLRSIQESPVPAELISSLDDYDLVRRLLQNRLVASADEGFDPLAADMVSRANVYLGVKFGTGSDNPFCGDYSVMDRGERPSQEFVTRREIADLGNLRSRLVRRLITYLQRQPEGYEHFRQMGFVRRPPERDAWQRAEVDTLIAFLRPWSAKQVRTHFDQLRRAGMITAEREMTNGPWRYALPEELRGRRDAYRHLPLAAELIARRTPE